MVAGICIAGIFIYLFFWSRKMRKEQISEWEQIGVFEELEEFEGIITLHSTQKKRFFNNYWYVEIEANMYSEKEKEHIKMTWKKPFTNHLKIPELHKNKLAIAKGYRRQSIFYANQIKGL